MAKPQGDMHNPESVGIVADEVVNPPGTRFECRLPHWCVSLTLAGTVDYGPPRGGRFPVNRGGFQIIRIHTPQLWKVTSNRPWRVIYCVFDPRPHWLPWLDWREIVPGYALLPLGDARTIGAVYRAMRRVVDLGRGGQPDAQDFMYHALEEAILLCLRRYRRTDKSRQDPRVEAAMQYVLANLMKPTSLDDAAVHCRLSRTQLAFLFKKHVGTGLMAFWNQQRMARAMQLLRMSYLSIKQVAIELGFGNPKYFSTCFRRIIGTTPQKYRCQAREA